MYCIVYYILFREIFLSLKQRKYGSNYNTCNYSFFICMHSGWQLNQKVQQNLIVIHHDDQSRSQKTQKCHLSHFITSFYLVKEKIWYKKWKEAGKRYLIKGHLNTQMYFELLISLGLRILLLPGQGNKGIVEEFLIVKKNLEK